jgi:hypothetical protein
VVDDVAPAVPPAASAEPVPDFGVDKAAPAAAEAFPDAFAEPAAPPAGVPADAFMSTWADPVRWAISAATLSV